MSRGEKRFEVAVTAVLLAGGVWYLATMLSYPAGSGRIPAIVAVAMIGAAAVQLVALLRRREDHAPDPAAVEAPVQAPVQASVQAPVQAPVEGPAAATDPAAVAAVEPDTYDTLIRLRGTRRRLFLAIAVWTVLFYLGSIAVGFVVTFAVLFAALLLYVRERPRVAVVAAVATAGALYAFMTLVLDLPALRGTLIG